MAVARRCADALQHGRYCCVEVSQRFWRPLLVCHDGSSWISTTWHEWCRVDGLAKPERRTTYCVPPGVPRLWPRNSYRSPVRLSRKRCPGCRLRTRSAITPTIPSGEREASLPLVVFCLPLLGLSCIAINVLYAAITELSSWTLHGGVKMSLLFFIMLGWRSSVIWQLGFWET